MNKKELRKETLSRRDALTENERTEKSEQIMKSVTQLDVFQKCNKILLYAPIRSEVDTQDIYKEAYALGKEIYYPVVQGKEMEFYCVDEMTAWQTGAFGVREPEADEAKRFAPEEDDRVIVIMPGTGFDREGNRIGYGGGYYDKYLQKLADVLKSASVCKIVVAYECQVVDVGRIKKEEHDVRVDFIITEKDVISCVQ